MKRCLGILLVVAAVQLLGAAVVYSQSMIDPSAWSYRAPLAIANPGATPLTDFHVRVALNDSFDFARVKSDGSDIRFTSDDGLTLIPFWIETWNPAGRAAVLWVKIPAIAASGTTIYLYYGNGAAASASDGVKTFEFFDDFESSGGGTIPGYYQLGAPGTALVQDQSWEDSAPHSLSVVQNNSGGYTYWGYYGLQAGCGGVGLAFSNDLVTWTKRTGPLFLNGRWPSVLKAGDTFYMFYTKDFCATSHINLATSVDGINFTDLKTVIPPQSGYCNQNPNLFHDPNDGKYYLYWYSGDDASFWEIHARSAATPEGLDDPATETVVLRSTSTLAAPNMLFRDGTYFLSTEARDGSGQWITQIYSSTSPTNDFVLLPGNPVLDSGSACNFQQVVGTELHDYYCKAEGDTWTIEHRVADLTAGRLQFAGTAGLNPQKWTASGGSWNMVTTTQQDGSTGGVIQGAIGAGAREVALSSYTGADYVLEGYGRLLSGVVWGLGTRATDKDHLYSANLYTDLDTTDNLYAYAWAGGGPGALILGSAATGQVDTGAWYKLAAKVHGNSIDVYKDDVLKLQGSSSQYASGAIALYGEQNTVAQFNNVRVRKYAAAEPFVAVTPPSGVLFQDDFTRDPAPTPKPFTWVVPTTGEPYPNHGVFDTIGGSLNARIDAQNYYGFAYSNAVVIDNHSVETDISFPKAGVLGGGIFGRLDVNTGQRYGVWVYPEGSLAIPGGYGPAVLSLIKFYDWGSYADMRTVSIPALSSTWHHLKMNFTGNRIQVFYDGSPTPLIDMPDDNTGGYLPYTNGYTGVDMYSYGTTFGPSFNNFVVRDSQGASVYAEDFGADAPDPLSPWNGVLGTWTIASGILQGASLPTTYGCAYTSTQPLWTDYAVEGRIRFPAGAFGGGLGARLDPATGARYSAWIYPDDGSAGGSNMLRLVKFRDWTSYSWQSMAEVNLPAVGTDWHTLKMECLGSRIRVSYDGARMIDVTDNNYDGRAPYLNGGISFDMWTYTSPYTIEFDDIVVQSLQ